VLTYCGVGHVMRALFGVVAASTADQREAWLDEAGHLAVEAMRRAKSMD
jgi:NAD(P)H dehydrogenase (quinone)